MMMYHTKYRVQLVWSMEGAASDEWVTSDKSDV